MFNFINRLLYRHYFKYLDIVEFSANKLSKGRNTRVGAYILDDKRSVRSIGYNGAPRGSNADLLTDKRNIKPEKYYWIVHAEINAICNAASTGTNINNCIMVVSHLPCMDCDKAIIQSGIKVVITKKPKGDYENNWKEHIIRTRQLFKECNVKLIELF